MIGPWCLFFAFDGADLPGLEFADHAAVEGADGWFGGCGSGRRTGRGGGAIAGAWCAVGVSAGWAVVAVSAAVVAVATVATTLVVGWAWGAVGVDLGWTGGTGGGGVGGVATSASASSAATAAATAFLGFGSSARVGACAWVVVRAEALGGVGGLGRVVAWALDDDAVGGGGEELGVAGGGLP